MLGWMTMNARNVDHSREHGRMKMAIESNDVKVENNAQIIIKGNSIATAWGCQAGSP